MAWEILPEEPGGSPRLYSEEDVVTLFESHQKTYDSGVPGIFQELCGISEREHASFCDPAFFPTVSKEKKRRNIRQGWQNAGPGAPPGSGRSPEADNLQPLLTMVLAKFLRKSLTDAVLTKCKRNGDRGVELGPIKDIDPDFCLGALSEWEKRQRRIEGARGNVWSLFGQLGIPSLLIKVKGCIQAIALNAVQCSNCGISCEHIYSFSNSLRELSVASCMTVSDLESLLHWHGKRIQTSENSCKSAALYVNAARYTMCVVSSEVGNSLSNLSVVKKVPRSGSWICLSPTCATEPGICSHAIIAAQLDSSNEKPEYPIQELIGTPILESQPRQNASGSNTNNAKKSRTYASTRSVYLIPTPHAKNLDIELTRAFLSSEVPILPSTTVCSCGWRNADVGKQNLTHVSIECDRVVVAARQLQWIFPSCSEGHFHDESQEGLVWISRFTAYSEVTLFRALYAMVLGGATATAIEEARLEALGVSTTSQRHKSEQTFRKALQIYAHLVSCNLPAWLFRCRKCCSPKEGGFYYEQLAFDGFQVGFDKAKSKKEEQSCSSGQREQEPIFRNGNAAAEAYIVKGRALRKIIFEALRTRPAPLDVSSVEGLCRSIFTEKIHTKEVLRAALKAIQLMDRDGWRDATIRSREQQEHNGLGDVPQRSSVSSVNMQVLPRSTVQPGLELIIPIFCDVLDCKRVSRALATLMTSLRANLLGAISREDRDILCEYQQEAASSLLGWLMTIEASQTDQCMRNGSEQSNKRSADGNLASRNGNSNRNNWSSSQPLAWAHAVPSVEESVPRYESVVDCRLNRSQVSLRPSGSTVARHDSTIKVVNFISACLTEPTCVWMRDGSFDGLQVVTESFKNVSIRRGIDDLKAAVETIAARDIRLLAEGVLAAAGSIEGGSTNLRNALVDLLEFIPMKHRKYLDCLYHRKLGKQVKVPEGTVTPLQFDMKWFSEENNPQMPLFPVPNNCFWDKDTWAPDFPRVRPSPTDLTISISDTGDDSGASPCIKSYYSHKAFTPGTFAVSCLCSSPKYVAVIVLKNAEGCRMPFNFIVERCRILPRKAVYDFACGTLRSAIGLSAEVVEYTQFVVDRFHYSAHKSCSLAMHADSRKGLRGRNTSSQEQRNSLLRPLERSLRGTDEAGFKNLTVLAHALHNGRSMYRESPKLAGKRTMQSLGWTEWLLQKLISGKKD